MNKTGSITKKSRKHSQDV